MRRMKERRWQWGGKGECKERSHFYVGEGKKTLSLCYMHDEDRIALIHIHIQRQCLVGDAPYHIALLQSPPNYPIVEDRTLYLFESNDTHK